MAGTACPLGGNGAGEEWMVLRWILDLGYGLNVGRRAKDDSVSDLSK